ncbi:MULTISPECIES: hypothetical protein [Massilia]|uniref:hypothetical protein n=1 Tax=Massilia TaxID=149698 RepID=UPI001C625031|nr:MULTISPECIES: hypothetical protein [Massilia]QYG01111.1 hypothetical protein KY496_22665 [Massilia sp. NP310]
MQFEKVYQLISLSRVTNAQAYVFNAKIAQSSVPRKALAETSVDETILRTISCLGSLTTIGGCILLPVKLLAVSSTVAACGGEGAGLACTLSGETISGEAGIQQES